MKNLWDRRKILWSLCQPVLTYPAEVLWVRVGKYISMVWILI
jgi:hypothetical protein